MKVLAYILKYFETPKQLTILRKLITILRKQFTIYREIDTRCENQTEKVRPQRKYEQLAIFELNEVKS